MFRAFRYRFYPTKEQRTLLNGTLQLCCRLHNDALDQRRCAHNARQPVSYRIQQNQLPELKSCMKEYYNVHSQVLQDVLRRVDRAVANYFDRVERRKKGEHIKAGYPRFKPEWRYNSITYPQAQNYWIIDGHIMLPKIGKLRVFMHRDPIGEIKTITMKRDSVGDWFVVLTSELPDVPRKTSQTAIGVDVGLVKLVQASNGEFVEPHRFYRKSEERLKRAQRQLSREVVGSNNRARTGTRLAKVHRKIQRQRQYFLHRVSKELVSRSDLLVFGDLNIQNMARNQLFAESIYDASWGTIFQYASYKASSAGKSVVRVELRGTTCDCACGTTVKLPLSERTFHCPSCGLTVDRDLHGSFGTLRKVGWEAAELTPVEMRPLLVKKPASLVVEAGSPRL